MSVVLELLESASADEVGKLLEVALSLVLSDFLQVGFVMAHEALDGQKVFSRGVLFDDFLNPLVLEEGERCSLVHDLGVGWRHFFAGDGLSVLDVLLLLLVGYRSYW